MIQIPPEIDLNFLTVAEMLLTPEGAFFLIKRFQKMLKIGGYVPSEKPFHYQHFGFLAVGGKQGNVVSVLFWLCWPLALSGRFCIAHCL